MANTQLALWKTYYWKEIGAPMGGLISTGHRYALRQTSPTTGPESTLRVLHPPARTIVSLHFRGFRVVLPCTRWFVSAAGLIDRQDAQAFE